MGFHPSNCAPPGWRRITEKEFAQGNFFTRNYGPREYRQMLATADQVPLAEPVFAFLWFDKGRQAEGYAIESDYWAGGLRFYAFGCQHTWRGLGVEEALKYGRQPPTMHDHVHRCDKCGQFWEYNSSG